MQEDHAARVWDDAHLGISPPPPRDVSLQGRLDPALLPPTVVSKLAGSGTGVWKDAAPPPHKPPARPRTGHSHVGLSFP